MPHTTSAKVQADPLLASYVDGLHALAEVWTSMMWVTSTHANLLGARREIARWAQDTNRELTERFGLGVASEEVRVVLSAMADWADRLPDDARLLVTEIAEQSRALTAKARAALGPAT